MRYVNLAFLENRVAKPGNYDVLKGVAKNFSIPAAMIMRAKVWPRRAIRD